MEKTGKWKLCGIATGESPGKAEIVYGFACVEHLWKFASHVFEILGEKNQSGYFSC